MTVHQTILDQLGGSKFRAMTGARDFVNTSKGLSFRVGKNDKGVTHVKIELTDLDLYDVTFYRVRGATNLTVLAQVENVYADRLQTVFTENTGLDTRL